MSSHLILNVVIVAHAFEIRLDVKVLVTDLPEAVVGFRFVPDFAETLDVRHTSQGCHSVGNCEAIFLLPSALHRSFINHRGL
jgi:hypothetical protein